MSRRDIFFQFILFRRLQERRLTKNSITNKLENLALFGINIAIVNASSI